MSHNYVPLLRGVASLFLVLSCSLSHAQSDKAWYKPKVFPESFKLDRDGCQSAGKAFSDCMGAKGWTFVDRSVINNDRKICNEKSGSAPAETRSQTYVSCMIEKGWDEVHDTTRQIGILIAKSNDLCKRDEYRDIFTKSPCLSTHISLEHLADMSKISPTEKIAMLAFVKEADAINANIDSQRRIGSLNMRKFYEFRISHQIPKMDENRVNLVTGRITFGEYNKRRKELLAEQLVAGKRINDEVDDFIKQPPAGR